MRRERVFVELCFMSLSTETNTNKKLAFFFFFCCFFGFLWWDGMVLLTSPPWTRLFHPPGCVFYWTKLACHAFIYFQTLLLYYLPLVLTLVFVLRALLSTQIRKFEIELIRSKRSGKKTFTDSIELCVNQFTIQISRVQILFYLFIESHLQNNWILLDLFSLGKSKDFFNSWEKDEA